MGTIESYSFLKAFSRSARVQDVTKLGSPNPSQLPSPHFDKDIIILSVFCLGFPYEISLSERFWGFFIYLFILKFKKSPLNGKSMEERAGQLSSSPSFVLCTWAPPFLSVYRGSGEPVSLRGALPAAGLKSSLTPWAARQGENEAEGMGATLPAISPKVIRGLIKPGVVSSSYHAGNTDNGSPNRKTILLSFWWEKN